MAAETKSDVRDISDGKVLENRSCTDWIVTILWILFLGGWLAIIGYSVKNGDLNRVLLASNFEGRLCGVGDLASFPLSFVPLLTQISYSICVPACPNLLDYVCNNVVERRLSNSSMLIPNSFYNMNQSTYFRGLALGAECVVRSCSESEKELVLTVAELAVKVRESKCFPTSYRTSPVLNRCFPAALNVQNLTVQNLFNETTNLVLNAADQLGFGTFFPIGMQELQDAWPVILICFGCGVVLSLIWMFLLRCILAPLVYLSLLLMLGLLIVLGILFYFQGNDAAALNLPGASGLANQVVLWRVLQFTSWALAFIFVVAVLFLLERIRIAIAILQEASKAFLNNVALVCVPPIAFILLAGYTALFVMTALYITTLTIPASLSFNVTPATVFGESSLSRSELIANNIPDSVIMAYNSTLVPTINISTIDSDIALYGLQAYNFFAFLWGVASCIFYAFFVIALVCVSWYFSATAVEMDQYDRGVGGRMKTAPRFAMLRSVWIAFRYHLGTILFGSLLIAIIQFIRAVVLYLEHKFLNRWKNNATIKCALCMLNCCLACIERVIKIVSQNAFVVCCIKDINFCRSAVDAIKLIVSNALRMGTVSFISTAVIVMMKLIIVGVDVIICWNLLKLPQLTHGATIRSGLFPVMAVLVISYFIAALFLSVYEYCVDAILMCFFVDEEDYNGKFLPPDLAKLLNKFRDIEAARKAYDEKVNEVAKS